MPSIRAQPTIEQTEVSSASNRLCRMGSGCEITDRSAKITEKAGRKQVAARLSRLCRSHMNQHLRRDRNARKPHPHPHSKSATKDGSGMMVPNERPATPRL